MLAERSTACAAVLLLACANALLASDTTFVKEGERVRVKFEQETPKADHSGAISYQWETIRLVGSASALGADTLVVLPEEGGTAVFIPRSAIEQLEVAQGTKSSWLFGGIVGGGVGVVAGGVLGALATELCDYDCPDAGEGAVIGALLGGAGLFGIGAGIGALFKSDHWVEAQMAAPPPVALNVGKDGSVQLAFSLRL
jgi:hypothetical protein